MSAVPHQQEQPAQDSVQPRDTATRLVVLETRWQDIIPNLATKADVAAMRADIKADIARIEQKVELARAEVKTDIARIEQKAELARAEAKTDIARAGQRASDAVATLRAEMKDSINSLIRWIVGTGIALLVALVSLLSWTQRSPVPAPVMQSAPVAVPVQPAQPGMPQHEDQ